MTEKQEENFDEKIEEEKVVTGLSNKEIKKMIKPMFSADPEKYYPTQIFGKLKFTRAQCPKCHNYYWRCSEKRDTCGDSNCVGKYTFIGTGMGIGKKGQKITYAQAWKSYEKAFTTNRIPSTSIPRYPVVARWRNDVDYCAAGIYCYQPYCVSGEIEPPANPLVQPQFCVRFNDLDNIGITGRHYSGFIMLGNQVFNYANKFVYFKEEVVEFHYRWLTEFLEIDPAEITFIEDIWAGGGNVGPSVEYFVAGMEIGNMVFMQYKCFPDGSLEPLDVKVIDVGTGLERVPWVINGSATSYEETFQKSKDYLLETLNPKYDKEIFQKLGPYTSQLDVDENDDIEKTWKQISETIQVDIEKVKAAISPIRDIFIVLDHTRSLLMVIQDGSLPSNVGGGFNVRNILRRTFSILHKNGWWEILKMEGFLKIFEKHREDLSELFGQFAEYKSFNDIIKIEYERWSSTDTYQKVKLEKILQKKKNQLSIDDWIVAVTSWGLSADAVAEISKIPIPNMLYYEIANRQGKIYKAAETQLYSTQHLPQTQILYYEPGSNLEFKASVLAVFENKRQQNAKNIVVLNQTKFYPTSGGQDHDSGTLVINGKEYEVVDCTVEGKCIFHILGSALDKDQAEYINKEVTGKIDQKRRQQLRNHHTATHIVFTACRQILGPHIWQHGAKKTVEQAHLDVTHYQNLDFEQEQKIEFAANQIVLSSQQINKFVMEKTEAEKKFGFKLYQGGIVPGDKIRIVQIGDDIDTEACCGTHCDNTNQVGFIKILKTQRISDGILRLYFVAGENSITRIHKETKMLSDICALWSIPKTQVVETAERFFKDYKKLNQEVTTKTNTILNLQINLALSNKNSNVIIKSFEKNATLYFSYMNQYAQKIKDNNVSIFFYGENFIFGIYNNSSTFSQDKLKECLKVNNQNVALKTKNKIDFQDKNKKKCVVTDVTQISFIGKIVEADILKQFEEQKFIILNEN